MGASAAYNTDLEVTGAPIPLTNEAMSDTGDGLTWEVSTAAKDILDWATALVVEVSTDGGATWNAVAPNSIDWLVGRITFGADQSANQVRVSGKYRPRYRVARGRNAPIEGTVKDLDASHYKKKSMQREAGLMDVKGEIDTLDIVGDPLDGSGGAEKTLEQIFRDGEHIVISVNPHPDDHPTYTQRAIIQFTQRALQLPVSDIISKKLAWSGAAERDVNGNQVVFTERL